MYINIVLPDPMNTQSLTFFCVLCLSSFLAFSQPMKKEKEPDHLPNTFILKLKDRDNFRTTPGPNDKRLKAFLSSIQTTSTKPLFPHLSGKGNYGKRLSNVWIVEYKSDEPVQQICKRVSELSIVEYAEPYYLFPVFYVPNDPLVGQGISQDTLQYYLERVHAYEAWDLNKGNSSVVVGIVDDGILNHEDLVDNMYKNMNDPIDGIDNDNDGYTDNYLGWDIGDNDPDPLGNSHGVTVSGVCCAKPDNGVGIAGLGFNTPFMPIKAAASTYNGLPNPGKYITHGYEGIVYAADHNCKVINLSWGGSGYSHLMEEIINYAVEEKDVVVVAAAGNSNNEELFYPASYEKVISVASCSTVYSPEYNRYIETKALNSNYNYEIDIAAPGELMYTTIGINNYNYTNGTSLAAPLVSAAAALVRAAYPALTAIQVKELLRVTADVMDTIPANQVYKGKLGSGRLNLYKALTAVTTPSIRLKNYSLQTNTPGNNLVGGEAVSLRGDLINYLHPTQNLYVKLSTESSAVTINQSTYHAGTISTLQVQSLPLSSLTFTIQPSVAYNEKVILKVEYIDSTLQYYDRQYLTFILNQNYKTHDKNQITLTVGANGRFGFIEKGKTGTGFEYQNESYLYEGGLMIAYNNIDVSDCVRSEQPNSIDQDFYTRTPVTVKKETTLEQEFYSEYTDLSEQVDIKQTSIATNSPYIDQCILLEYQIKNRSSVNITNIHVGLFTDWDIAESGSNSCLYDLAEKIIHTNDGNKYCGIALVSDHMIQGNCIDNQGTVGALSPNNGFSPEEKFTSISNTQLSDIAGKDVSMTMGITLAELKSQESKTIAFGLFIGNSQLEVAQIADSARKYYEDRNKPALSSDQIPLSAYPNPFHEELMLDLSSLKNKTCTIKLSDLLGQSVFNETILADSNTRILKLSNLQEGIYILEIASENKRWRQKIVRTIF